MLGIYPRSEHLYIKKDLCKNTYMLLFILEPSWKSCRCPAIRTGKQRVAISTTGVGHQDSAEKRTHEKSEDWQAGPAVRLLQETWWGVSHRCTGTGEGAGWCVGMGKSTEMLACEACWRELCFYLNTGFSLESVSTWETGCLLCHSCILLCVIHTQLCSERPSPEATAWCWTSWHPELQAK